MLKWLKIYQLNLIDLEIKNKRKIFSQLNNNENYLIDELDKLINNILDDFKKFEFDKMPSVEIDKIKFNDNKEIVKRAKKLSNISLLNHINNLLNIVENELNIKNINDYIIIKLLALLHDAGKSKLLRIKYGISDKITHEEASYLYAKEVLKGTSFEYVPEYLLKDSYYLDFLRSIDKIAREKELKFLQGD